MRRIFVGAALAVAGIAAFIEAHSHRPGFACLREVEPEHGKPYCEKGVATGLSQTAYDLLRIGAWALLIVGGLLVIVGLIGYWAHVRRPV